jgi:hypothetical protein
MTTLRVGKPDLRRHRDFVAWFRADDDRELDTVIRDNPCPCGASRAVFLPGPKRWSCLGCGE